MEGPWKQYLEAQILFELQLGIFFCYFLQKYLWKKVKYVWNINKKIFLLQGRVVTETTTEYKEVTDDSGFENFGANSNFPQLSSSGFGETSASTKVESSESSSDEEEDSEEKFQKEALKVHNDYRAKHGVEDLKLDKKVSKQSHLFYLLDPSIVCN